MAGFDNDVLYADNVDFSGTLPVSGQINQDGELLVGSSVAPNIRSYVPTGSSGVSITTGSGTLDFSLSNVPNSALQNSSIFVTAGSGISVVGSPVSLGAAVTISATSTITTTQYDVLVGGPANTVVSVGPGSAGQVLQSGGASANPAYSTATYPSAAGSSGNVLTSDGTNWTSAAASGGGITWTEVTGTSQAAAVNNGYIANNGGLVTITLPASFAVGAVVRVAGLGAGLWSLVANTGDIINFGSSPTSASGSITATNRYDSIEVLGVATNTTWVVLSSIGNLTVA